MEIFGSHKALDQVPGARVLVVALHAFGQTTASLKRAVAVVREVHQASDVYKPPLPSGYFSTGDPEHLTREIARSIERIDAARRSQRNGEAYQEIILIGHSAGAILARRIFVLGDQEVARSGNAKRATHWTDRTTRIVLLAATSRGWMVSSALDPFSRFLWASGSAIGHVMRHGFGLEPYIFAFRRGAPFLTSARLQWLQTVDRRRSLRLPMPITVQLLGTDDDYVAPTDNVDLATSQDQNYFYLEVLGATHKGIVKLDLGDGGASAKRAFKTALEASPQNLSNISLKKEDVFDFVTEAPDDYDIANMPNPIVKASHVVFVIHGIRDRGFWTRRIARRIKERARKAGLVCHSVTSTYGYFPMGPFLLPWVRRIKVEWLLDQYVNAKALYPEAEFAYIGHSNGTYLLAKALELCPDISFRRVIFAGSVVAENYRWQRFLIQSQPSVTERPQGHVEQVLNYIATGDWVVALFPNGIGKLRLQRDLGAAGHNGFAYGANFIGPRQAGAPAANPPPTAAIMDIGFMPGQHSAALAAANWDDMTDFVLHGRFPKAADAKGEASPHVARLGRWSWAILLLLAGLIVGFGYLLLVALGLPIPRLLRLLLTLNQSEFEAALSSPDGLWNLITFEPWHWAGDIPAWILTLGFLFYLWIIRLVLAKA